MGDLDLGGGSLPGHWGYPSPLYNYKTGQYDSNGMVWHGKEPATLVDVWELRKELGPDTKIDLESALGGYSFYQANVGKGDYKQVITL